MTFIENIKETFGNVAEDRRDSGDLVSTIIIIAIMAVAALLTINWISTAIVNSAADVAQCIEGSNAFDSTGGAVKDCEEADHAGGGNSFEDTSGYKNRFE